MGLFSCKISLEEHEADLLALRNELEPSEPSEWLVKVMSKRVLVHLVNDQTIEGSLVAQMDDGIVLRAAQLLGQGNTSTAMAGEVWVPRDKVAFAQLDG